MSTIPIDKAASPPALELPVFSSRIEPRPDDSFKQHLRRAEKPQPVARKDDRVSKASGNATSPEPRDDEPVFNCTERAGYCSTKEPEARSQTPAADDTATQSEAADLEPVDKAIPVEDGTVLTGNVQPVLVANEELSLLPEDTAATQPVLAGESSTDATAASLPTPINPSVAAAQSLANSQVPDAIEPTQQVQDEAIVSPVDAVTDEFKHESDATDTDPSGTAQGTQPSDQSTLATTNTDAPALPEVTGEPTAAVAPQVSQVASTGTSDESAGRHEKSRDGKHATDEGEVVAPAATETQQVPAASAATQSTGAENDRPSTAKESKSAANAEIATAPASPEGVGTPQGRLPQHLLARVGEHSAAAKPLTEADQARFVQRVARAFQTAANQDGELKLRLSPPELGSLRLEVKVLGGVMSARIETENSAARTLLLENLPALRERLAEQNIRVDHFDVDLMNRQGSGQPNGTPQDQGHNAGGPSDGAARFSLTEEPREEPVVPRTARRGGDGQLNVLV